VARGLETTAHAVKLTSIVALVTGGASGLGRATARRLAAEGACVVLADLPNSAGAATAAEIGDAAGFVPTDVTDADSMLAAVEACAELGDLRVLVTCAGIAPPGRIVGRDGPLDLDAFRRVVEVNLVGTFNAMRLAAARMTELPLVGEERGVIVCTASVAAFEGQVGQAAYAASKAGVAGLTICAARDLADKAIRVATIAPGIFETPMLAGLPEAAQASLGVQVPHPSRLGRADEYADLVAAIVHNSMINGETIRLDGAIRMAPR
jgi:NAD(P)-dependent dehydrogenase (short-subunit alcohol dehydrogenase family)